MLHSTNAFFSRRERHALVPTVTSVSVSVLFHYCTDGPRPTNQWQAPTEAEFASKEDLERWGGGGAGASSEASRHAAEAAEQAREAVAKASKVSETLQTAI